MKFGNAASLPGTGRLVLAHMRSSTLSFALNSFNEKLNVRFSCNHQVVSKVGQNQKKFDFCVHNVGGGIHFFLGETLYFELSLEEKVAGRPIILSHIRNACRQAKHRHGGGWVSATCSTGQQTSLSTLLLPEEQLVTPPTC